MKLSEAIRLGAMLRPQGFDDYWDGDGSCAIGAACEANGITAASRHTGTIADFEKPYDSIFKQVCPACGVKPDSSHESAAGFINTVVHLNDKHRWTREAIADWVATIEAQHEAARQPTPQPAVITA